MDYNFTHSHTQYRLQLGFDPGGAGGYFIDINGIQIDGVGSWNVLCTYKWVISNENVKCFDGEHIQILCVLYSPPSQTLTNTRATALTIRSR